MTESSTLTLDALRTDVAEMLGEDPTSIADDEDLTDRGLDSIQLMALTERWREAGAPVAFLELAESPVLRDWWARVRG